MSDSSSPHDAVAAILDQFPGPATLAPSRLRMVATSIGATLIAALALWLTWDAARRGSPLYAIVLGLCALVCAYAAVVATLAFITDLYFLRLDVNGFEAQFAWHNRRLSWDDVGPFTARSFVRGAFVTFEDATRRPGLSDTINRFMFRENSLLPGAFGLANEDMARLMTEWRARALGLTPWIRL